MKKIKEYIVYKYDQFLSLGTSSLILGLLLGLVGIIAVISAIMLIFFPEFTFNELLWWNFLHTLDPGVVSGDTGDPGYLFMMTFMTFVGIFIFSLFISFVLNGFQQKLETLRKGRSKVIEKNHVVILGNGPNLKVVLHELVQANENQRKGIVVVLSEEDPLVVASEVKEYVHSFKTTKVIYRKGSIFDVNDLEMCRITYAKSVIILEEDITIIKALVALMATGYFETGHGNVAATFQNIDNMHVAQKLAGGKGNFLYVEDSVIKIIAQSCLQTGLSCIYSDLFDFAGDEIYVIEPGLLVGRTYLEAQLSFSKSIAIGIIRNNESLINPEDMEVIQPEDLIVVISEDDDTAIIEEIPEETFDDAMTSSKRKTNVMLTSVLFIGYNHKVLSVLTELDNYVKSGSQVTILMNSKIGEMELGEIRETLKNIKINILTGETYERHEIEKAIENIDKSVVIFTNENVDDMHKDSQTLLSLLHLRDIEKGSEKSFEIITEINNVVNTDIIELSNVDDFVISNQLTSRMLTQIAENKYLVSILEILLNQIGSEVYIKPIEDYVDITKPMNGYTLVKACAKREETFLGYKRKDGTIKERLFMNPLKSEMITFNKGDKIIVLSQD